MSNLIDRQAAINALGERPMVWTDNNQYALGERNQYDMDRLAIETLPSAQPEIIRCKDCKHGKYDIFDRGMWCELHPSLEKRIKEIGYKGCRNCANQIEPLRMCEWAERGGDGELHFICPRWERRTDK